MDIEEPIEIQIILEEEDLVIQLQSYERIDIQVILELE